jgi:hypothetical protein
LTALRTGLLFLGAAFVLDLALVAVRAVSRLFTFVLDRSAAALRGFGVRVLRALDFATFFIPSDAPVFHESVQICHAIFSTMAL